MFPRGGGGAGKLSEEPPRVWSRERRSGLWPLLMRTNADTCQTVPLTGRRHLRIQMRRARPLRALGRRRWESSGGAGALRPRSVFRCDRRSSFFSPDIHRPSSCHFSA